MRLKGSVERLFKADKDMYEEMNLKFQCILNEEYYTPDTNEMGWERYHRKH